jgi:hypothetical protein
MVSLLRAAAPPLAGPALSVRSLKQIARDWMDDVHDYCNVTHYTDAVDPDRAAFNRAARRFRAARPWLQHDFGPDETLVYHHPCNGTVLFAGLRQSPDGREQVLFAGNMEGAPVTVTPTELPLPHLGLAGWQLVLAAPGLDTAAADASLQLTDAQAVLFTREAA